MGADLPREGPIWGRRASPAHCTVWRISDLRSIFSTLFSRWLQRRGLSLSVPLQLNCWQCHCPRRMRSRVYASARCPSVRPSVLLCVRHLSHPAAARRYCRFAAAGPAGRRYRSIAARRDVRRAAGECGQCRVVSVRSS